MQFRNLLKNDGHLILPDKITNLGKFMKEKTFEKELPEEYKEVFHLDARNIKFGIIFNAIALLVTIIVTVIAIALLALGNVSISIGANLLVAYIVLMVSMIAYIVLHELVHGIAYKSLTGEKLTFGMSWSCAFCGVPNIYTYRRTALISLTAPLIVFSVIFIALAAVLYFVSPVYYLIVSFLFGLHLGGCSGDIYVTILFLTKFKDKSTLMKDTGPEQFFYVKE